MIAAFLVLAQAASATPATVPAPKTLPNPAPNAVPQVQPAPIGYLTAADLATRCTETSPSSISYCFAFVTGVHDTAQAYELWLNQREFCPPAGLAQADLRRTFLTYLVAYPQNRGGEAASVVLVSLKESYPC